MLLEVYLRWYKWRIFKKEVNKQSLRNPFPICISSIKKWLALLQATSPSLITLLSIAEDNKSKTLRNNVIKNGF